MKLSSVEYNSPSAQYANATAIRNAIKHIEDSYVDGPHRQASAVIELEGGYLITKESIPLPVVTIAGQKTIIPTTIVGNGTTVVVNADAPAIHFRRGGYSATAINAMVTDNPRLIVENVFLQSGSRDAVVVVEDSGKDFAFRDVQVTGTVGNGFRIARSYGGMLSNCYAYACAKNGFQLDNVAVLTMAECTARECRGDGVKIFESANLSGSIYCESNYGYGFNANDLSDSSLTVYHENNRRAGGVPNSGARYRQGRLEKARRNIFTGRTGGAWATGFHFVDSISRIGNLYTEDLLPLENLVVGNSELSTSNNFGNAYSSPPLLEQRGESFRVVIPAGCYNGFSGGPANYWTPTSYGRITKDKFLDGDEVAISIDVRCDEAAVRHFNRVADSGIRANVDPRLLYVGLTDGTKNVSTTVTPNGEKTRIILDGKFDKASSLFFIVVISAPGAGPDEDLTADVAFNLYKLN